METSRQYTRKEVEELANSVLDSVPIPLNILNPGAPRDPVMMLNVLLQKIAPSWYPSMELRKLLGDTREDETCELGEHEKGYVRQHIVPIL